MAFGTYLVLLRTWAICLAVVAAALTVAATAWGDSPAAIGAAEQAVISVRVSPDGKYVAVSSCDSKTPRTCRVQVFRAADGTLVHDSLTTAAGGRVYVSDLTFTRCLNDKGEEALCLTGYDAGSDRIIVWDIQTGKVIKEFGKGSNGGSLDGVPNPAAIIGTPVSTSSGIPPVAVVVVEGETGTIEFRDGNDKRIGAPVPVPHVGGTSPIYKLGYAPDGSFVVTTGSNDRGNYACIVTGTYQDGEMKWTCRKIKLPGLALDSLDISPYGKIVIVILNKDAVVIDKHTGKIIPLAGSKGVRYCVFLTDGVTIACINPDGTLGFWDAKTGKLKSKMSTLAGALSLAPGPNNSVYIGDNSGTVKPVSPTTTTPSSSPSPSPSPGM